MQKSRFLLLVVALVLVGSACGDDSTSSTTTTSAAGSGSPSADGDMAAFTDCLREHGVDLPTGGAGLPSGGAPGSIPAGGAPGGADAAAGAPDGSAPAGFDATKFQEAQQACQDVAPEGGFGAPGGGADNSAYRSCLQDHGVEIPDPAAGSESPPSSVDVDSATFQAAQEACQSLQPTASPGASTTTVAP